MFSFKILKIFLLAALFASACRFWQAKTDVAPTATPIAVEAFKSRIPFDTKEPETFQAEIVVAANGVENVIFTARSGANRLTIYDFQTASETAVLQTGAGGAFLINRRRQIYAENEAANGDGADEIFPVAELLNQKENAVYEQIADENDSAKFLVRLDDSPNSEIVITVDKKINLPVRQEFFSVAGERKSLTATTELRNFTAQVDARNFEIPADYKKVSLKEFETARRDENKK